MAAPGVAVYGIEGADGFAPLAAAAADAAPPAPPAPPPPAVGPMAFDGTQASIERIQPAGFELPAYGMPYSNYEFLSPHLQFYYNMPSSSRPAATPAAGNPRGIALFTIKNTLKLPTSPLKTAPNVWSNSRIIQFVDDAAGTVPDLAAGAVFDANVFASAILAAMNTLTRQNANRGGAPALAALIPITRPQIGI